MSGFGHVSFTSTSWAVSVHPQQRRAQGTIMTVIGTLAGIGMAIG
jgi:hypothetical protein